MEMEPDQTTNDSNNTTNNPLNANPVVNPPSVPQTSSTNSVTNQCISTPAAANVVTIPVPIVHNEGTYAYVTVKGSLHDRSCSVFGLNDTEIQALWKRFQNSVKPVVNGVMVSTPPMVMLNTLAELSYKVVCSCGEAEICWTLQREI